MQSCHLYKPSPQRSTARLVAPSGPYRGHYLGSKRPFPKEGSIPDLNRAPGGATVRQLRPPGVHLGSGVHSHHALSTTGLTSLLEHSTGPTLNSNRPHWARTYPSTSSAGKLFRTYACTQKSVDYILHTINNWTDLHARRRSHPNARRLRKPTTCMRES